MATKTIKVTYFSSNLQKLEGKYSLESTDPRESEIRAPPQPLPYLMPIPPNTLFFKQIVHIDDADLEV